MSDQLQGPLTVNLKKGDVLCAAGEEDSDLYIIHSGRLLVYVIKGTQVTPLAYLEAGEYIGELSFFDRQSRSAYVMAIEDSDLIRVPIEELDRHFPPWLITIAKSLTEKIRYTSDVIRQKGIRRKNVETMKPLPIEDQREFYLRTQEYLEEKGLLPVEAT